MFYCEVCEMVPFQILSSLRALGKCYIDALRFEGSKIHSAIISKLFVGPSSLIENIIFESRCNYHSIRQPNGLKLIN